MQSAQNQVRVDLDLAGPGKQYGRILLPDSRNDGAWSLLAIPVVTIAGAPGPSALVMAGNHGDEYEGQLALFRLAQEVTPEELVGRLIVVPCLSGQASRQGTRLWPSGANFNRLFGDASGTQAEHLLAAYLAESLFPMVDTVFDIHSGGRSLLFHPMTTMTHDPVATAATPQRERMIDAMLAWNADYHMTYGGSGQSGLLPQEAERQGKVVITGEMGGGAISTNALAKRTYDGLRNVLRFLGHLNEPLVTRASLGLPDTVLLRAQGANHTVIAPASGLFETLVDPGQFVEAGQPVGRLHFPERPDWKPEEVSTDVTGVVAAIRSLPPTSQGDALLTIGEVIQRSQLR